jgi:glycosyltransferase involved in cell wall biosynthesis
MRISTIMPAYNSERYIAPALDSVLSQTRPPDEIIVVDDGSTDGTLDVLRAFANDIRIIRQQKCGISRALNVAIAAATGDAFAFLDCDDLWAPEKLQIQNDVLSAERDLEAVFGAVHQFASPELPPETVSEFVVPDGPQPGISKNTLLIRRAGFERIGRFDEHLVVADFVDWYARANVLNLRWRMLPQVVALRRHHPGNAGRHMRAQQVGETLYALNRSLNMRRRK